MTELEKCNLAKQKGFTYDSITGNIRGVYGKIITRKHNQGYVVCRLYVGKKPFNLFAHRLAWFLHYGSLPINQVDHIDGNTSNNSISNLRDVTHQQNNSNRTSAKGFCWNKQRKKFQSYIKIDGKIVHLGVFTTKQDARNAYLEAKKKQNFI